MKKIDQGYYTGERALYMSKDLEITNTVFEDGESHLKESRNLKLDNCVFRWKYPLWNCENVEVINSTLVDTARSGLWYTNYFTMKDSIIEAPKQFRRCHDIELDHVQIVNALETLWNCKNVELKDVNIRGDYFGLDSKNIYLDHVNIIGNYCFDGCENVEVHNSVLVSKDAFWNCENVVVYDSKIIGEYLAWNTKNITFINCTIESEQGLCYIDGLTMKNCTVFNTSLALEYVKNANVEIVSHIDSIKNPISGVIQVKSVGELIMDNTIIDPTKTQIIITDSSL